MKIMFEDKVALNENPSIADINKVTAGNMNEIKTVVNGIDDTLDNIVSNTSGTAQNKAYSQEYINNLNAYSTTEKRVGTWIDGKPIYRKSYQYEKTTIQNNIFIDTISNLDVIVNCQTYLVRSDGYKSINNFYASSSDMATVYVNPNNIIEFAAPFIGTLYVTLEYTKSDD